MLTSHRKRALQDITCSIENSINYCESLMFMLLLGKDALLLTQNPDNSFVPVSYRCLFIMIPNQ